MSNAAGFPLSSTHPAAIRLRGAVVPVLILAGWLATVDTGLFQSPLLVPLHTIAGDLLWDENGRAIWPALASSLTRLALGFAIGALAGIVLGVALGLSRPAQRAVAPTVHTLRQVTLFAWIPLLTAWFGNGEAAKIVFIAIGVFFPVFVNTEQGLRTIPLVYREVASVSRLGFWTRVTRLLLPGTLPSILIGIEVALLTAWIGTVGAEYAIGTGSGVGSYLATAREQFRMDLVLVGVLVLAAVGYALSVFSHLAFRKTIKWRGR
jgi:sulfonate transport system permease protein